MQRSLPDRLRAGELGVDLVALARTLAGAPGETLRRTLPGPEHARATVLPGAEIVLHEPLGAGGMGVVHRGTQSVMAREVAVKRLRGDRRDAEAVAKIVQEALVLGRIEHPNVVPVYTVDADEAGLPRIVMKRVDGDEWSRLLADDEAVRARGGGDRLQWHLRVFLQVCNAVAYAHSRGIVHLDIKPGNVMLGRFGEVYLLDWGVAQAISEEVDPRVPRLQSCDEVVGTPCYMAPEMLAGDGALLGTHTDVYLLGATLFEVATGRPPHTGETLMAVFQDIVAREPTPPPGCPQELAALLRRCLALDPADRPPDALAVARAVEDILEHHASRQLCADADAQRERVLALLAEGGVDADEDRLHEHFGGARFGYANALARWPDNTAARRGLEELTRRVVEWELARDRPAAAAAALAANPGASEELHAAVAAAQKAAELRASRLSALEQEHDPRLGQRTRLFLTTVLGAVWIAGPLIAWIDGHEATAEPLWVVNAAAVVVLVVLLAIAWWGRASLMRTAMNRGVVAALTVMLVVQLVIGALAGPLGLTMAQLQALVLVDYLATAAYAVIFVDRRMWPSVGLYALATGLVVAFPDARNLVLALANLGCWLNAGTIWRMSLAELRSPRVRPAPRS